MASGGGNAGWGWALVLAGAAGLWWWHQDGRPNAPRAEPEAEALESFAAEGRAPSTHAERSSSQKPTRRADPEPRAPAIQPGQSVEIALSEPAAAFLGAAQADDNEHHYRRLLRELAGPDVVFSGDLGRAAREFVYTASVLGRQPPSDIREFLLRGAGALAGDTTFQHATTSSDGHDVLRRVVRDAVREPLDGDGPLIVGIGEVFAPGAAVQRHIGVVATRLPLALRPCPRRVELGQPLRIHGRLLVAASDLELIAVDHTGADVPGRVERRGDELILEVEAPTRPSTIDMQLVGVLPRGPGKLVQLRVEVARPLRDRQVFVLPGDESGLRDARDAAALAWRLLNDDRRAAGLPALAFDARLAAVAEAHSRDMRDAGFFGHRSPSTGMHADRLARAGYGSAVSAENLALNVSIAEAERGLMASLGHRRNLLGSGFTHGAVGVVGEEREDGGRRWWVTQLFARPIVEVDADAEAQALAARIDAARREKGLAPLQESSALSAIGREVAPRASRGSLEGLGQAALGLAQKRGSVGDRLRAFVAQGAEVGQIEIPEAALTKAARRLGVGVAQDRGSSGIGNVGVVILVGE